MATLGDVLPATRNLLDDDAGDWATNTYLIPKVNICYSQCISKLEDASCNPFAEDVRDLPGIAAGTTNFIDAVQNGKPWARLENPLRIYVKPAGTPEEYYREIKNTAQLPNVSPVTLQANGPGGLLDTLGFWEWRGQFIYITPFDYACDFRMRGDFRPPKLLDPSDVILVHADMENYLTFSTAGMSAGLRENQSLAAELLQQAGVSFDSMASKLTKQTQSATFRFARTGSRRRY